MTVCSGKSKLLPHPTMHRIGAVLIGLALIGCSGRHPIREVTIPAGYYSNTADSILSSRRISKMARAALDEDLLFARRCPDSFGRVLAAQRKIEGQPGSTCSIAEICVREARRMEAHGELARATGLYLAAAKLTAESACLNPGSFALSLYNHATAQVAELLMDMGPHWPSSRRVETPFGTITVHTRHRGNGLIDPYSFNDLQAADSLVLSRRLFPSRMVQAGVGGVLVAFRHITEAMLEKDPFMPPLGQGLPVTATIEFRNANTADLKLHNIAVSDRAMLLGKKVTLAADFSAPLGKLVSHAPRGNIGFRGMLRPAEYFDLMGLYTLGPLRKDRIPVILVHGLNSRPATWLQTMNTLITDRQIRENYQFWYYLYPTGIPLAYSAAGLRHGLDAIREHYAIGKNDPKLNDVVVVGHSMGGLLTSLLIRTSTQGLWDEYFSTPIEDFEIDAATKQQIEDMLLFEARPFITRAVFIATPHRGSPAALGPIGKLLANLIRIPSDFILLRQPEILEHARELGRVILTSQKSSVNNLSENNPILQTILQLPIKHRVKMHSIIGDRGKQRPLEKSSDGIVPYSSSHLEGVVSEKIVPAGHSAHHHPEAIEELRRILLLHLRK